MTAPIVCPTRAEHLPSNQSLARPPRRVTPRRVTPRRVTAAPRRARPRPPPPPPLRPAPAHGHALGLGVAAPGYAGAPSPRPPAVAVTPAIAAARAGTPPRTSSGSSPPIDEASTTCGSCSTYAFADASFRSSSPSPKRAHSPRPVNRVDLFRRAAPGHFRRAPKPCCVKVWALGTPAEPLRLLERLAGTGGSGTWLRARPVP